MTRGWKTLDADRGSEAIALRHRPARAARDRRRCGSLQPLLPVLTWRDAESRIALRFRPEHRRLCRLHRERRSGREGHRRARRDPRPRQQFRQRATIAPPKRGIEYILKGGGRGELSRRLHLPGLPLCTRDHRGQGRDHRRSPRFPISSATDADRRASPPATRWSIAWSRTRSGRSAPTSSRCRPTARSATSVSAGPATRRSLRRPPATFTTAHDFLRKWLRDVMADQRDDGADRRMSSPDPTRLHPDKFPGFFGSHRLG